MAQGTLGSRWRNRCRRPEPAGRDPRPACPRPRPARWRLRNQQACRPESRPAGKRAVGVSARRASSPPRTHRGDASSRVRRSVRASVHRPCAGSRSRQEQRVEAAPLASAAAADSPLSHSGKRDRALRARPRHPPLAAVPLHLHTGGPGLRATSVHWLRSPSLSLHKTHMELHVHRVGSSMKT